MSFTPPERETLLDMVRAAERIGLYVRGMTYQRLLEDWRTQDGLIRHLSVIGEAARRLPGEFRSAHAEIPWASIIGMRNVLVHNYDDIRLDRLWLAATVDVPALIAALEPLLPPPPVD